MKKIISYVIIMVMVIPLGIASAFNASLNTAFPERVIFSSGFEYEDSILNGSVFYIDPKGEDASRVTDGFMEIKKNTAGTDPYFDVNLSSGVTSFVFSMDLKMGDGALVADLLKLRYTDNSMASVLSQDKNGNIYSGGKIVTSLSKNKITNLAAFIADSGNVEIYVNGELAHTLNTGKKLGWQFVRCQVLPDTNTGSILIDNLKIYSAKSFAEVPASYIMNKTFDDKKTFKEGFVRMSAGTGNSISHMENASLQITTGSPSKDPYADIIIPDTDTFSSLVFSADFTLKKIGSRINVFQARNSSKKYLTDICIKEDGSVLSGTSKLYTLSENECIQLAVIYNVKNASYDVYINGEKKITGTNSYGGSVERVRIQAMPNMGAGSYTIDNLAVYEGTALRQTEDVDSIAGWSVLASDRTDIVRLGDAVAYHTASDYAFYNGEKHLMKARPYIKNNEVYLPSEIAFPLTGTTQGGDMELGELCKEYGKEFIYDRTGLIVVTDGEFPYKNNRSVLNSLSTYIFSERPDAARIAALYEKSENSKIHPRLLLDSEDFDYFIAQKDEKSYVSDWINSVISDADNLLETTPCEYRLQEFRLNAVVRVVIDRIMKLSFAYRVTGNDVYAQRALSEMEKVTTYPDWNPQHFLDTAELTFAMAIGYDWCYDYLLEKGKTALISDAILTKGLKEGDRQYRGRATGTDFIFRDMNWNSVCNAGMCIGALAVMDTEPEFSYNTVKNAVRSLEYMLPAYAPDGGWQEGVGYWEYAHEYLSRMSMCMMSALGTDFDIPHFPGVENSIMYAISMYGNKASNNFHDSSESYCLSPLLLWAGSYYEREDFTAYYLDKTQDNMQNDSLWKCLYYDRVTPKHSGYNFENDIYFRNLEAVSMRDGYSDRSGAYLSFHAGKNNVNHRQYDAGTFVLDMLGERWASDLGTDNLSYLGVSAKLLYRMRPEGHNTLVINPSDETGQESETDCPVTKLVTKEKGAFATADLTSAYINQADSIVRGFMLTDNRRTAIIRDEISLKEPSEVYWFMHTTADVEIKDNNTAILTIGNKSVQLKAAIEGAEATLSCMEAAPLPQSAGASGQADNSGYRKVAIKLIGSGDIAVSVRITPLEEEYAKTEFVPEKISQWKIEDGEITHNSADYSREYIVHSELFDENIDAPTDIYTFWKKANGDGIIGGKIQNTKTTITRETGIGGKTDSDGCVAIKTTNLTTSSGADPFVQIECKDALKNTATFEFLVYAEGNQSVYFQLIDESKKTVKLMEIGSDGVLRIGSSTEVCKQGKWHNIAVTFRCHRKIAEIFLDGKRVGDAVSVSGDVKRIKIISLFNSPSSTAPGNGITAIDNIRVYNGEKESWYHKLIFENEIYVNVSPEAEKTVYLAEYTGDKMTDVKVVRAGEDIRKTLGEGAYSKIMVWDKYSLYPEIKDIMAGGNQNE